MSHSHRLVRLFYAAVIVAGNGLTCSALFAGQLYTGAATISITPEERVALDGQFRLRVSEKVESPCTATALAIETRDGEKSLDQAVFVSCDLVGIYEGIPFYEELRAKLGDRIPEFLQHKIIVNATHTHTGPVTLEGVYPVPESGVMQPREYRDFLMGQLADVIVQAWEKRAPASVAWGLGYAVIAHNRRVTYSDGTTAMYGQTDTPRFRGMEGSPDHGVEILYFWDANKKLIATAINVACPSQEVEGRNTVNADIWHQVRHQLKEKYGDQLQVLGWCGAAGDQSPHVIYRKAADARMRTLRGEPDLLNELARRIVATWEDVRQLVEKDQHQEVALNHHVEVIQLPRRKITKAEADAARVAAEGVSDGNLKMRKVWFERLVQRYEDQESGKPNDYLTELHVVRLGDIAIATNDFELYTDYGVQMKARSPALQTFVIQLCGNGTYLPTERAAQGGGYSAVPESNVIGPEGGQVLVEETVKALKALWPAAK